MNKPDGVFAIMYSEARAKAEGQPDLESRLKAAMALTTDEKDKQRLKAEIKVLASLNAAASGVPVDMKLVLDEFGDDLEPIGLNRLWKEVQPR